MPTAAIVVIDAATVFHTCDNELLFADHVHPNEKGQALVAKIVARNVAARRSNACAGGAGWAYAGHATSDTSAAAVFKRSFIDTSL